MKVSNSVNKYRRIAMRTLTCGIGSKKKIQVSPNEVRRVLVSRPNSRLGNQLLITPLVQELSNLFPNAQIDLFVRGGISSVLFRNYSSVGSIFKLPGRPFSHLGAYIWTWIKLVNGYYDLAINAQGGSSSGRLSVKFSRAKYKVYDLVDDSLQQTHPDYQHMAKRPVYNLRKLLGIVVDAPILTLSVELSPEELEQGRAKLHELTGNDKPTFCFYTFATGDKCYSKEWWKTFYARMKESYGEGCNLIEILPKENVSQIDFAAPSFYSLDLRELAAVMAVSDLFVGADCGMMHLAAASGVTTIGLFSVTDPKRYMPYGGKSTAIDMNTSTVDDILASMDEVYASLKK
jgi:heptosyltransferase-3